MLWFLIKIIVGFMLVVVILGFVRTFELQWSPNQTRFTSGALPSPAPDGFYKGSISFHVPWIGKKFDAATHTGINVFDVGSTTVDKYSFKTYEGKGIADEAYTVLKIDYNVPGNPFWLHPVLDEIVQVGPDHYLGKFNVRIFNWFSFTLGFFELQK